jgi:hypothetical protein
MDNKANTSDVGEMACSRDRFLVVCGLLLGLLLLLSLAAVSLLQGLHALFTYIGVSGEEGFQLVGLYNCAQLDLVRLYAIL